MPGAKQYNLHVINHFFLAWGDLCYGENLFLQGLQLKCG